MACPEESGKDTPTVKQRHELGKLTECLNKQGKKLLELQATLFKVTILIHSKNIRRLKSG